MPRAKIYVLNVESEVEDLSTRVADLREKALRTLTRARAEYDQIPARQPVSRPKRTRQAGRNIRQVWEETEERIEDAFEHLDEAIRQIRKPFRS